MLGESFQRKVLLSLPIEWEWEVASELMVTSSYEGFEELGKSIEPQFPGASMQICLCYMSTVCVFSIRAQTLT
jgi:hypothetical protein